MGINKFNFSHFFDNKIHASIEKELYNKNSKRFAIPIQKHTSNVKFITKPGTYENIDGLITSKEYDVILTIKVADCVPIYIHDLKKDFYGLLHSGWKGTKNNIIKNALSIFFNKLGSKPENIKIYIGPHIKECCYEIDWDVAKYFSFVKRDKIKNKWMLNLEKEITKDALGCGIYKQNISSCNICTFESLDCESFRRDKSNAKRMLGIIG